MSQVWFITGCSTGFGHEFALQALSHGDRVIATARNATSRPELIPLSEKGAKILDLDVTSPRSEIDNVIKEAIGIYGQIDILVNNAGYVEMGLVEEVSEENLTRQLETNFYGTLKITQSLLPHFRSRRTGKIAFIGSILGIFTMGFSFPYSASKFLIAALNESLNVEMKNFGVKSIYFDVGHFRTEVVQHSKLFVGEVGQGVYGVHLGKFGEMSERIAGKQPGDPRKGVNVMVDVLRGDEKRWPLRMPIGGDAVEIVRGRCEELLGVVKEWEEIAGSTDFEGVESAKDKKKRTGTWRPKELI